MHILFRCFLYSLFQLSMIHAMDASAEASYWNVNETSIMHFLKPITIDEEPSGLVGVNCIYLINLDRRPERLARMKNTFKQYALHVQRFAAIDGQQLTNATKKALFGPYPVRMTNGAIGCLLSHLSILYDAYERGFACIWILEDDVMMREDPQVFVPLLETLNKQDPEWDLFFTDVDAKDGEGNYVTPCNALLPLRPNQPSRSMSYYQKKEAIGSHFYRIRQRFGTWSMFVSRKGMQKLLDYYQHVYLWYPYDLDLFYAPHLRCYTTRRDIVIQIPGQEYSDTAQ